MQSFSLSGMQVHDNTLLWKEAFDQEYVKTVQGIIQQQPFGPRPFYIYQFIKRVDDVSGIKKMMHQPRLTKPLPTPGATLLRVDPLAPEQVKIVWTIPNQENFGLYEHGKMFENEFVWKCIQDFLKCFRNFKILKQQYDSFDPWKQSLSDAWLEQEYDKCFEQFTRPEKGDASQDEIIEIYRGIAMSKRLNSLYEKLNSQKVLDTSQEV